MANRNYDDENRLDEGKSRLIESIENRKIELINKSSIPLNDESKVSSSTRGIINQILLVIALLILTAACGMPIGYSVVILPQLHYNASDSLRMDAEIGSWFASVHSLALPFGAFASGPIMDYFGRKPALVVSSLPLLFGWLFIACASTHWLLLTGRVIAGFGVGLIAAPCQILIAECVDPKLRGFTIAAPYISYSLGILLTYSLGVVLHWRHVAWCSTILPIISLISLCFVPESPTWLARHEKLAKAKQALKWLRYNDKAVERDLADLVDRIKRENEKNTRKESLWKACRTADVLKPMIIINGFHLFLIFSGTYLIVFYAVDIITEVGVSINSMTAAVLTALVRTLCTFIFCCMLFYIKRRTLVIIAGLGSTLCSFALATFVYIRRDVIKTPVDLYFSAICILSYVAFNTGFMVIPGIMVGELIPARVRGRVAGIIYAAFNIVLFLVIKLFPQFNTTLKTYGIFCMFGFGSFLGTLLVYLMLPETKSVSLGEIEDYFKQGNWLWITRKRKQNNSREVNA